MSDKYLGQDGLQKLIDLTQAGLNEKQETLVSGTNIKTIDGQSVLGSGNLESIKMVETTWSELKTLRDGGNLIPGRFYRITDYTCTTVTANTSSAGHVFDIIVRADSASKLSEEASAIQHAGDIYFNNSKLEAWKLWYCLDNDTARFEWADSTNGKGVIYRMIDEFNNDCPYDFKNILFTYNGTKPYTNAYTFTYTESSTIKDASLLASKNCYSNVIGKYISSGKQRLNFNVFYSTSTSFGCYSNTFSNNCYSNTFSYSCYSNTFGIGCSDNIFGTSCPSNTFGNSCYNNTFGNNCQSNTFGNNCHSNTFDNYYQSNTFGNHCQNNSFGKSCQFNTFDDGCYSNTFGNYYQSNTFGNSCTYNTFGERCSFNTFGNICSYITFGDSSSTIDYCQNNIIDNGCSYLNIMGNGTASSSNQLQYVHIHLGVKGTSSNRRTITVDRNLAYSTDVYANNSQTIILND